MDQSRSIVCSAEVCLVEACTDSCIVMRMCIQSAAYIEDPAPMHQPCDGTRPPFILLRSMYQKLSKDDLLIRCTPLANSAPVAEAVPGNKANKSIVDLMHEQPD